MSNINIKNESRRTEQFVVRVTQEDKERLEQEAEERNLPLATYVYMKAIADENTLNTKHLENLIHEMQEMHSEEIRTFREEYDRDMRSLAQLLIENFKKIGTKFDELGAKGNPKDSKEISSSNNNEETKNSSGYVDITTKIDSTDFATNEVFEIGDIIQLSNSDSYQILQKIKSHGAVVRNQKTKENEQFNFVENYKNIRKVFRKY